MENVVFIEVATGIGIALAIIATGIFRMTLNNGK